MDILKGTNEFYQDLYWSGYAPCIVHEQNDYFYFHFAREKFVQAQNDNMGDDKHDKRYQ